MRSRIFAVIIILINSVSYSLAQRWVAVDPALIATGAKRDIIPDRYVTYNVEPGVLQSILLTAPDELTTDVRESPTILSVGLADGTVEEFRIVAYSMMEPELSRKYSQMRTYRGVSINNTFKSIRIDWTSNGFRAVVREPGRKTFIDPFQRGDLLHCIAYYKNDIQQTDDWSCGVKSVSVDNEVSPKRSVGDCTFRSYRLAQAANGEYCNFFGATSSAQSAIIMSEVITAINRVNEVYEVDISVRLILVANTDTLFFYNPSTDPYTNGNGSTMLGQNQTTCDNRIGSANYDIGHVFSTGGGGVAYLKAVCNNSLKAGGVTGQTNPVGDPFYIDYVAHEMGHQFGGNHTQNNSCNRNSATAMEPGSASTIMGYAGICSPNVQNNSDAYFHGVNLQEIASHVIATSCDAVISTANSAPVVANLLNYTIPISTPFVLTASATDPNNNPMTYCWEQWDQEVGTMPPASTNTVGPMFRSLDPTTSPSRYFYNLTDLVNNVNPSWEELPSVARSMEFYVTVRDYNGQYGCSDEDNTIITTTTSAGPFTVTSQNSGATWQETSTQTITWNVANTTAAPVNCATVNILMSYDGGFTYPVTIASNEPNDGSATITVPAGTTTDGRIMVKAVGNVFFDINNQDITVEAGIPNFTLSLNPPTVTECNDGNVSTTVNVGSFLGFINPVTLSVLNAPPGSVVTFLPAVVIPGNSSQLTISNLNGLTGAFTPTVRGTSTTGNKDAVFTINLTLTGPTQNPSLVSPANNATDVLMTPLLEWNTIAGITSYEYQVASDDDFDNIAVTGTVNDDQFLITSGLDPLEQYYWRVRGLNICGAGTWSPVFTFTTSSCFQLLSIDVPKAISASGTPTITSLFTTNIELEITDLNIVSLIGTHSWVDDLQFLLKSPSNTEVLFWNRPCNNNNANFNINFDDEASSANHPCPPTNGGTYKPGSPLTPFDGQNSSGTWTLTVKDLFDQDGGSLNSWGLKVCGVSGCELVVTEASGTGSGTLPGAFACAGVGDTIFISAALAGQTINVGSTMVLNKNITILSLSPDITITCTGLRPFHVNSGVNAELHNLILSAGTSLTGGAILNQGTLQIHHVSMEKNPAFPAATLLHNTGSLKMSGTCNFNQ